jgi:outer membrane receptor protein involved in Fe transport
VNLPSGRINGVELETRHDLGYFVDALSGLTVGANATFLRTEADLSDQIVGELQEQGVFRTTRPITNAPERLYNIFANWDVPYTGTSVTIFYTVTGDTLIAGSGEANGQFIPDVYRKEFENLNFTLSQRLGPYLNLRFQAKNITNPTIRTEYRIESIERPTTETSFSTGVDYSLSLGGEIRF